MVKDLSIVIVSWNVKEHLRENLARLFSLPCRRSFEVFVVDNASHDGTGAMVRTEFPQVKFIQNDWGSGFSHANNQALRIATGEVIVLLNPDMVVGEGVIDATYEALVNDKTIGVLGVRLNDAEGKPLKSVRRYPGFTDQLVTLLKIPHLFPNALDNYIPKDFDYTMSQDVDAVRGSYFAFRREILQTVGYLDQGYFIWFEEVDYCRRTTQAGLRVRYLADVQCRDLVGRGTSKMKRVETQAIFTASMVHYFYKWHPMWQAAVFAILRLPMIALAWLADRAGVKGKARA